MTTIATPLTLPCGLELPNRLVKAAMTERISDARNGVTERHIRLYKAWGEGGAGAHITGNVQLDRRNLEAPGNVVIDAKPSNEQASMLARWAEAMQAHGGKALMQISHAGRQTPKIVNEQPDAPSAVTLGLPGGRFGEPKPMDEATIRSVIERFGVATRAAKEAGFDGVQLHGAHGYLISQFLSPISNQRDDQWGGSIENRARFLLDVVRAAKAEAGPGFAIGLKLNSSDFQKGGFSEDDSSAVIGMLNEIGLDFLEISGGTYEQPKMVGAGGVLNEDTDKGEVVRASTAAREAYFLYYAQQVRGAAKIPLLVTGGFRSVEGMNAALAAGEADMIGLGRPLCADPDGPAKLLSGEWAALPRWEDELRLGRGFFSKTSPIAMIRMVNVFGAQAWYYAQLQRIADGKGADKKLGLLKAFLVMEGYDSKMAKAYRKALEA